MTTTHHQCEELKLIPNPSKCENIHISFLKRDVKLPAVHLCDNKIQQVSASKEVGLVINSSKLARPRGPHNHSGIQKSFYVVSSKILRSNRGPASFPVLSKNPTRAGVRMSGMASITHSRTTNCSGLRTKVCRSILGHHYRCYTGTMARFGLPRQDARREQVTLGFGKKLMKSAHPHLLPQLTATRRQSRHSKIMPPSGWQSSTETPQFHMYVVRKLLKICNAPSHNQCTHWQPFFTLTDLFYAAFYFIKMFI